MKRGARTKVWARRSVLLLLLVLAACGSAPAAMPPIAADLLPLPLPSTDPAPIAAPTALPPPTPEPPRRPIYVLDSNDQGTLSRILVVDPDARRVAFEIPARFLPELAVSGDGRRLYVADTYQERVLRGPSHDVVSVYDARTGELQVDDTAVAGRLHYKGFPLGSPFIFLSTDDTTLYVMKYGDPDTHDLRLQILDASTLRTQHEGPLPDCGRLLRATADAWLCFDQALTLVDPRGARATEIYASLRNPNVATAVMVDDGRRAFFISPAGEVTEFDVAARKALQPARLALEPGWRVAGDGMLAPDGKPLYLGVDTGKDANQYFADAIVVYDTTTWRRLGTIEIPGWLAFFALSAAGDQLYVVNATAKTLTIYDTATFETLGVFPDLGGTPSRVLVPSRSE